MIYHKRYETPRAGGSRVPQPSVLRLRVLILLDSTGVLLLSSPTYSAVFNFNLLLFSSKNARKLSAVSSNRTHCS
jgi:hypothetical protein